MTEPLFDRLAVIGLGLLGGSVALATRERGLAREVVGVDRVLTSADPIPVCSLADGLAGADLVVIAVPVEEVDRVCSAIAPHLGKETLITDTVSLKLPIAEAARRLLPFPERCVGAHPMAGGEVSGFSHATPDLFEGAPCILALEGSEPAGVVDRIERFWQGLGAFTVRTTPAEHDAMVAVLSHAPHAVAYAFARTLSDRGEVLRLAGPGLRDFLRIARANPELWAGILLRNRQRVAEELARFEKNLGEIVEALGRADREALERVLREGARALDEWET